MKVSDIIRVIEKTAPLGIAAPWDASGIQVAAMRAEVSHVCVLLDPTLESLERAVTGGAEFILCHHPLSLNPRFPNRQDSYLAVLSLLLRNDVWLYSAHTTLDANPDGPVRWLAQEMGLSRIVTLEPLEASPAWPGRGVTVPDYGFGFTGTLDNPMSYNDFCRKLSVCMGRGEWQGCGRRPEAVFRVACCPGSGGSMINAAVAAGADVFISGDIKYHIALEALSSGLRVLDVGHFILEEEMMRRFAKQLDLDLDAQVSFIPSRDPLATEHPPQA